MNTVRPGHPRPGAALHLTVLFAVLAVFTTVPPEARAASGDVGPPWARVHWSTQPANPCVGQPTSILFSLCECAWDLTSAAQDPFDPLGGIVLRLTGDSTIVCATCNPDSFTVVAGPPETPGNVHFPVRMQFNPEGPGSPFTYPDQVDYPVAPCSTGTIPYLQEVRLGQGPPCPGCPDRVCPNDSIDVHLSGAFPDGCRSLIGVSVEPNPSGSPLPSPAIIRLRFGNRAACSVCTMAPEPWEAHVRIPGLPYLVGMTQRLLVEATEQDLCAPQSPPTDLGRAGFPFVVAESCGEDFCYKVGWSDRRPGVGCNGTYEPGSPAEPVLRVGSRTPIAGVEGRLALDTPTLAIDAVTAARNDWVVQWSRNLDGTVHFIAFASSPAAAIPGQMEGPLQPVVRVRVRVVDGANPPEYAHLDAQALLVSDPHGFRIEGCAYPAIDPPATIAVLCRGGGTCDANGDAHRDVRDLVIMVGCLSPPPNDPLVCPPLQQLDCDASGTFDLDDVFCCGRAMLGSPDPNQPPPDSLRNAPEVALRFGMPRDVGGGQLEVPLSFAGLDVAGVAAARVELAYPDARYEVVGVTFDGPLAAWWTFHKVDGGRIRMALLDLSGLPERPGVPDDVRRSAVASALVTLRLRPGASAGGELAVAGHDFAAGDGVTLSTPNAEARLELGASGRVFLSAPRPNPFGASTAFALTLPVAGPVDVGVFDVAGRRVATLLRESSAVAGVYALAWNGSDDARGQAVGGVYFVRVVTGAGEVSRKLLFLPGGTR